MTYQRNETPEPLASATPITEAFAATLRAEFEAWATERGHPLCDVIPKYGPVSSMSATTLRFSDIAWEAYRSATERAAKQEWLPIATAPKNTPIRLYAQGGGFYDEDFNPSGSVEGQWTDDTWCGAFWDPVHDTWFRRDDIVPTHWMPLPDAPEAAAIRASGGMGASDE